MGKALTGRKFVRHRQSWKSEPDAGILSDEHLHSSSYLLQTCTSWSSTKGGKRREPMMSCYYLCELVVTKLTNIEPDGRSHCAAHMRCLPVHPFCSCWLICIHRILPHPKTKKLITNSSRHQRITQTQLCYTQLPIWSLDVANTIAARMDTKPPLWCATLQVKTEGFPHSIGPPEWTNSH